MTPIVPNSPIPGLPQNWWDKIIAVGKKIWDFLFRNDSKDLGEKAPVSTDSTVDEVAQINRLLAQIRQKAETETRLLEEQLRELVLDFAEDIRFAADLDNPVFQGYPVNFRYFDRLLDNVPHKMEGVIGDKVSRMVSLDSPEFYEAMRMMPGTKKEQRISELLSKAVETGLNTAVETAERLFREVAEEYNDALADAVSRAALSSEMASVQLEQLASAEEDDNMVAEKVAANAESVWQAALLADSVLSLEEA